MSSRCFETSIPTNMVLPKKEAPPRGPSLQMRARGSGNRSGSSEEKEVGRPRLCVGLGDLGTERPAPPKATLRPGTNIQGTEALSGPEHSLAGRSFEAWSSAPSTHVGSLRLWEGFALSADEL